MVHAGLHACIHCNDFLMERPVNNGERPIWAVSILSLGGSENPSNALLCPYRCPRSFSTGTVCAKLMMAQSSHTIFERGVQGVLAAFQRVAHDQRCQGQGRTRPLVSTDNA